MPLKVMTNNEAGCMVSFIYAGGETQMELMASPAHYFEVTARLQSAQDIIELMMLNEVIDRVHPNATKCLKIPYMPYARQDRITQASRAFSLKVFAKIINDLKFDRVISYDLHSDVTSALINNLTEVPQIFCMSTCTELRHEIQHGKIQAIVSPDAGAYKKASAIANQFDVPLIIAVKARDTATGELSGQSILSQEVPNSVLIVDDICDGGRTFIALANALKLAGAEHISLYITHGIFSYGYSAFQGLIDHIYTTNTFTPKEYAAPNDIPVTINTLQEIE